MSYNAIGDNGASGEASEKMQDLVETGQAEGTDNEDKTIVGRMRATCGRLLEMVKARMPDTSHLYLQPLNPREDMPLSDRTSLVLQSAQPWGDFFNVRQFNLPPRSHVGTRVSRNIETYLYNYLQLACVHLVIFGVLHVVPMLALVACVATLYVLYGMYDGDVVIGNNAVRIGPNAKAVIMVIVVVLAIVFGDLASLLLSVLVFALIVFGVHSIIREDAPDIVEDIGF